MEGAPSAADTVTPTTLITRQMIDETPGADRTIGMEMITDYVPGAYMTHDMLHMRGGHQTSWLIDGVQIPNTKIASNVGPQIDPKDIDSLETQRGSYAADVGDRTYGVFNVLPRNGFEFNRDGELLFYAGNLYTGEAQLSLGDHTEKTAWYASLTGSRSNYGLATPVADIYHDATNSQSAFVSLIRNQTPKDQLRLDAQYRQDYFQVPYDPNPNDYECTSGYYCSYGPARRADRARLSSSSPTGCTPSRPTALVSVAPFYHFNQSDYDSLPTDMPVATTWHQNSNYAGAQVDAHFDVAGTASPAGSTPSTSARTISSACRSTTAAHLRSPTRRPTPMPAWSSFMSPIICAWASTSRCWAASASPSIAPDSMRAPSIRASAQPCGFRASTGSCADSTATSSSPRRL